MKKKLTIKDFVTSINWQIGEGYEYCWECYGQNVCGLDWGKEDLSASAVMVYDTKTNKVYEMSVWDCRDEKTKVYRWIRPEYVKKHKQEAKRRGLKFDIAIDDVKYEETTPGKLLGHLKRLYKGKKPAVKRRRKVLD